MKNLLMIIFGFLFFISCKNINDSIAKFIFDSSKISNLVKYDYKYDHDKLISKKEMIYTLLNKQVVDSMYLQTNYIYNNKGLLIKEIAKTNFEDKTSLHLYNYNDNDSMILEMRINQNSDTITWDEYAYFHNEKKTIFHRDIMPHFDPNQNFMTAIENSKMDTSLYRNEFELKNDQIISQRQYNQKGQLTKTVKFEYENKKLVKEIHLIYNNSLELIQKVKHYDYSKSPMIPDYFSIDLKNDTLESCINFFKSDRLAKKVSTYDYGKVYIEEYYENGLHIGTIDYDRQFSMMKRMYSYEYDKKGILKTEKTYREKINAH